MFDLFFGAGPQLIAVVLIIAIAWLFRFPFLLTIGALVVQAGLVLLLFAIPNSQAVLSGVTAAVDGLASAAAIDERSRMILTYAICGFANVASVGIMTGGMTVLMPERRAEILGLAGKALLRASWPP